MGLLTDFFIAKPEDLEGVEEEEIHNKFSMVLYKRVDPTKIAILENILLGTIYTEAIDRIVQVRELSEDAWIFSLDRSLVEKLAALSNEQIQQYSIEWSNTEDWQLDKGDPESLQQVLLDLSKLSNGSIKEDKDLFLFLSL